MKFKDFFDEAFKGAQRQFLQQNPHMPQYVARDIYNNHVSPAMRRSIQAGSISSSDPGAATVLSPNSQSPGQTHSSFSDMMQIPRVDMARNAVWDKKPRILTLSLSDLDQDTLMTMDRYQFGLLQSNAKNDQARHQTQSQLASERGANNEPIIILKTTNKLKLLEGWHRTMQYFLAALRKQNPQQFLNLVHGRKDQLDYSEWPSIQINAYLGFTPGNVLPSFSGNQQGGQVNVNQYTHAAMSED